MTDTPEILTVTRDGLTPSRIAWRRRFAPAPGQVERMLDANPGLAAEALEIPVGREIVLPEIDDQSDESDTEIVDLWE